MSTSRFAFRILQALVWLMLFLVLVLFIILPKLSLILVEGGYHSPKLSDAIALLEKCNGVVMHTFIYAYVAFFGSCLASFLNVVAWRVPRGRSILGSSHCPACDHKLSMKDNIPVWGWLKNDGSCRHCQAPIAQRYLWVEVLLGSVFLVLFLAEIVFGGFNLPTAPDLNHMGIEFVLFAPNAQLIQTFAYHATVMSILFTVAMISTESFRIPVSFIACAALILVGIAFFCPVVLQVAWQALPARPANETLVPFGINAALTITLGAGVGIIAGITSALLPWAAASTDRSIVRQQLIASFSLVGLALGWQSVLVTQLIWFFLWTIGRIYLSNTRSSFTADESSAGTSAIESAPNPLAPTGISSNRLNSSERNFLLWLPSAALIMGATLLHILTWGLIYRV